MQGTSAAQASVAVPGREWSGERRSLAGACLAHFLHDGFSDQLYALLPVWQPEFGLSYAGLALVRALYYAAMGGMQVPADRLVRRLSSRTALALATVIAAAGYLLMALPLGFVGLCCGLMLAGLGSSVQHPRASQLVSHAYGKDARGPLGIYNFAGDLGKAAFPAVVALLVPLIAWRPVAGLMSLVGLAVAGALLVILPPRSPDRLSTEREPGGGTGGGFALLLAIGALDTATRMGYLLFLPFLLREKGGGATSVAVGLAVLFAGGALGKAGCGWLGQRIGVMWSVIATETATAMLMALTLALPLTATLAVLPALGLVLNGTSSVLYGTVPELARKGGVGRSFALFYTGVIGAGGLAPILYGAIADHTDTTFGVIATAMTAAILVPMAMLLQPYLAKRGS